MYITYESTQWVNKTDYYSRLAKHDQPPKRVPYSLPKADFMPTKLVRISDMKVVDGCQVNEGYCALSYSRDQSGENVLDELTGEKSWIDKGKHKIIHTRQRPQPTSSCLSSHTVDDTYYGSVEKEKPRFKGVYNKMIRKLRLLNYIDDRKYMDGTKKDEDDEYQEVVHVTFEGIIQQICIQFNITYLWYDRMCINQYDKKEKQREIHSLNNIYSNAYCTIALVPEFRLNVVPSHHNNEKRPQRNDFLAAENMLHQHQYFKRLWTLQEAIDSKRVLLVGRNIHLWLDNMISDVFNGLYQLNQPSEELNIKDILYHAHQRKTMEDHDRVFALINLFPDINHHFNIDYDESIETVMIRFYGLLAKKDISILFFTKFTDGYTSTMQKYTFLPSWTGVHGQHPTNVNTITTTFQNYNVTGKTMEIISCIYVTNNDQQSTNNDSFTLHIDDIPPISDKNDDIDNIINNHSYRLGISSVQQFGTYQATKIIKLANTSSYQDIFENENILKKISKELQKLSRFIEIKKENLCWYYDMDNEHRAFKDLDRARIDLSKLTEGVDDPFAQYVILFGIPFKRRYNKNAAVNYPIIKKKRGEEYYKAIGTCEIENPQYLFSGCSLPKQTFFIQ